MVVGWQHKNALFQPVSETGKTNSYSMWSSVLGDRPPDPDPPSPPLVLFLFWVFDFNNLCPAAACEGKTLRHTPPPPFGRPLVAMATASRGSEMAFHFGGEAHPLPASSPLLSAPFLWPVAPLWTCKDLFILPSFSRGQERSPLLSALNASRRAHRYLAAARVMTSDGTRRCVPIPACIF